jgi:hypothetical protein
MNDERSGKRQEGMIELKDDFEGEDLVKRRGEKGRL